jgi:hypothetical protein
MGVKCVHFVKGIRRVHKSYIFFLKNILTSVLKRRPWALIWQVFLFTLQLCQLIRLYNINGGITGEL